MAVALDIHAAINVNGTRLAHAAKIIAAKINQHDMFRALLLIGQQFCFKLGVQFRRGAARTRASKRAIDHNSITHSAQNFRA